MMKLYNQKIFIIILFGVTSLVRSEVTTEIFLADSNSPVEYQEIMVGTKLAIVVSSDSAEYWDGSIALMGESVNKATLFDGQALEAAGPMAEVWDWINVEIQGYDLYTDFFGSQIGDWFVINYTANEIGDCNVMFFDGVPYDPPYIPTYNIEFSHVPTRDFDGNTKVDFGDFALLVSQWNQSDCEDPNWCQGTDIDASGTVDVNDLMLFTEYWLEKTR
ncbi:MAG: hypothetical protein KAS96_05690 [Planctomycetes bacterium]|nr:hypothetical protein [Planctomycetota bacterium]